MQPLSCSSWPPHRPSPDCCFPPVRRQQSPVAQRHPPAHAVQKLRSWHRPLSRTGPRAGRDSNAAGSNPSAEIAAAAVGRTRGDGAPGCLRRDVRWASARKGLLCCAVCGQAHKFARIPGGEAGPSGGLFIKIPQRLRYIPGLENAHACGCASRNRCGFSLTIAIDHKNGCLLKPAGPEGAGGVGDMVGHIVYQGSAAIGDLLPGQQPCQPVCFVKLRVQPDHMRHIPAYSDGRHIVQCNAASLKAAGNGVGRRFFQSLFLRLKRSCSIIQTRRPSSGKAAAPS